MKTDFMKKALASLALFSLVSFGAEAMEATSGVVGGLPVADATMTRNGDLMTVDMDYNLGALKLKGDKAVVITPVIINGSDSVSLEPVSLFSRYRWYQFQRQGIFDPENPDGVAFRYSKRPDKYDFTASVPFAEWMNGALLKLNYDVYSCCHDMVEHDEIFLGGWKEFIPNLDFQYMFEVAGGVKIDSIQGRAYVDFPVNKIVIYPEYRNNTFELGKIIATIDSVKNDPDITITSIFIKGTASPEGPYDNNVYLSKNRTIALKNYVMNLYSFADDFIQTDYNPVDWPGLIEFLKYYQQQENNTINVNELAPVMKAMLLIGRGELPHVNEILAIAESDIEDFARNSKIKTTYPAEYDWLLKNVYPALRHSDYTIRYNIRKYTTVEEIREVLRTNPKRLSLDEIYMLASSYQPGTPEYNEVLETAARLFPAEVTANVNAANAAMSRGDYMLAENYLSKAGDAPEAIYAKGNLLLLKGDYQGAAEAFRSVAGKLPKAAAALQRLIEEEVIDE